jgi:hypothetical protein
MIATLTTQAKQLLKRRKIVKITLLRKFEFQKYWELFWGCS